MQTEAAGIPAGLEERIRQAELEFHEAYWLSQVDASEANEKRREELELELRRIKGDPAALDEVRRGLDAAPPDPTIRRSLELLRLSLTGNQMDDELRSAIVAIGSSVENDFAAFRAELDGRKLTDNDIDEILRGSPDDDDRRRVWEASKQVGAVVSDRVRELARLRNQAARALGYGNYYAMGLDLQELSETWLFGTLGELDRLSAEPFSSWKNGLDSKLAARFGARELYPWHYADPFFQSLPPEGGIDLDPLLADKPAEELAARTFSTWGFDLRPVLERSDLYPRERKSQHAFCLDVDRSGDVRILCNIVAGEKWIEVMLHESGHAAYDVAIDPGLPFLLRRAAHTFVTEAIAIMCGALVREPDWLTLLAGVPKAAVAPLAPQIEAARRTQSLLFARWVLVMAHFERDLYADPDGDLDSRWWDYVERFQFVARPPGRSAPDWAAKIHIAGAPVYYHNYLLGELLASQLRKALERDCEGYVGVPDAGAWLRQRLFFSGSLYRWDELVERATGRPLGAADFAEEVVTGSPSP